MLGITIALVSLRLNSGGRMRILGVLHLVCLVALMPDQPLLATALRVTSVPQGADVLLDGIPVGQTPLERVELSPDTPVELEVRLEDHLTFRITLAPERLRAGSSLAPVLQPLPSPLICSGPARTTWMQLIPAAIFSSRSAQQLKTCFTDARDWQAIETLLSRQLELLPTGQRHYDRARSLFMQGGTDRYALCAQDARRALGFSDLDACTRWRTQHLEMLCLLHCEHRGRRSDPRCQGPRSPAELRTTLLHALQNEAVERRLSSEERLCYYQLRSQLEEMVFP